MVSLYLRIFHRLHFPEDGRHIPPRVLPQPHRRALDAVKRKPWTAPVLGRASQPLPANTSLTLDRVRWGLRLENGPPLTFTPEHRTVQLHRRLAEAVEKSVHDLKIEPERWTLALSGGMDSRSLLYHLRGAKGLRTVTWGLRAALGKQDSDAAIARRLADQCQRPNEYVPTDADSVSFATILRRFLIAGEGRIDHLHGYMDGLNMWASLSASGRGILRGYDAFGRKPPVRNAYQARRASSLLVTTDYRLPSLLPRELTLSEQHIPLPLRTVSGESLSDCVIASGFSFGHRMLCCSSMT